MIGLRICFYGDPTSIHLRRWASFFGARGHDVYLISETETAEVPDVKLVYLNIPPGSHQMRLLRRVPRLRTLVSELNPDVFHSHYVTTYGYWGALAGFHPFLVTAWGSDLFLTPKRSLSDYLFTRLAMMRSDLVTVDSDDLGRMALEYGARIDRIVTLQFGVEMKRFSEVSGAQLKAELQIPLEAPVVLSMRNLRPLYNHDILVQAAPMVLVDFPETRFLFVGRGEQRNELERKAIEVGIQQNAIFLDQLPYERVPEALAMADVFVSIPSSDGTSVTLLEAMASAKPAICSDVPSNREWIDDGISGKIVPIRSEEATARAIEELLSSPKDRTLLGQRARSVVQNKGDQTTNMLKMERLYIELAARFGKSGGSLAPRQDRTDHPGDQENVNARVDGRCDVGTKCKEPLE